jgi:hypothetical protein
MSRVTWRVELCIIDALAISSNLICSAIEVFEWMDHQTYVKLCSYPSLADADFQLLMIHFKIDRAVSSA